jgi:hypothetical protein
MLQLNHLKQNQSFQVSIYGYQEYWILFAQINTNSCLTFFWIPQQLKLIPYFALQTNNWTKKKGRNLNFQNLPYRWCLQESNQGHIDFQSIALPTELRHRRACGCKYSSFLLIMLKKTKLFLILF